MWEPINWSRFPQDLPVTFTITTIVIGAWLGVNLGFIPAQISYPGTLDLGAWLAHFFHVSFFHLLSNLLIIIFMGMLLERPLGWWRYLVLVLLVWNLSVLGLYWFNTKPVLGFSGIGLGLMVLAYFYWQNEPRTAQMLGVLLLLNLAFGLMPGVSWAGHVVGALSGLLVYGLIRGAQLSRPKR